MAQGFFGDSVVRIGFGSVTDLRGLPANRADIAADFEAHHSEPTPGRISMSATQLYRFAHEIEIGDVVVTPVARNRSVSVGIIDGPYDWDEGPRDFKHLRRTVWLRHGMSRDRLSASTHEELSQRPTVFPLRHGRGDLAGAL
jgi:predicted Mrr-cat superfamily restriction endonuclease